ncbi:MAG: head-tail connector protein [Luteimonas sp.]
MLIPLTAATSEPVTVAEAKAHLRLTHASDDGLIGRQIAAAREYVELTTGRALATATYRLVQSQFDNPVELPLWPVSAVSSVSYVDASNVRIVLAAPSYLFDPDRRTLSAVSAWPYGTSVNIEFATAPALIPEGLKSAILLRVQAEYEANAEDAVKLRDAAHALAWPFRLNLGV